MKVLKGCFSWMIARVRWMSEPDFGADHFPGYAYTHTRHPDYYDDSIHAGQRRGDYADDYLAGGPRGQGGNASLAGFPRRQGMVSKHGWRIPTPPRLPVYD